VNSDSTLLKIRDPHSFARVHMNLKGNDLFPLHCYGRKILHKRVEKKKGEGRRLARERAREKIQLGINVWVLRVK